MISRRNYFAITIVMLVIVFLFQSTGVMTEVWNDYEENAYEQDREELPGKSGTYSIKPSGGEDAQKTPDDLLVYIGGEELREAAEIWAVYNKKVIESYTSLKEYENEKQNGEHGIPGMILIDSDHIEWESADELDYLEGCLEDGSNEVFCNMPEASVIKGSRRIRELFGIRNVKAEKTTVDGIHLYEGFLLGGEAVYLTSDEEEQEKRQDMDLMLPWYELEAGTEVYMKGIMEGEDIESEEYPVVIWKKNYRDAYVTAVNGRYMEDFGGIGLLSAITAQMENYTIYPIVNAQNMIVVDYPMLTQENEEKLMSIYSRDMRGVERDILWTGIMSVYRANRTGLSCMMAPQLDYEDDQLPDEEQLHYYMKNLKKEKAETGLSSICISDTYLPEKLEADYEFMSGALPDFQFSSFYAGDMQEEEIEAVMDEKIMSHVRTVITADESDDEIVGYLSEHVTEQKVLADGFLHTYRDDFRVRCVETMLGYSSVLVDTTGAVYPENEEDSWEKLAEDLSWNIQNGWKGFRGFQAATVSESDEYIRRFLALDYSQEREDNNIYLHLDNVQEPVWFILRTHNEAVDHVEGGSFTKLENEVFLLELNEPEAVITLESTVMHYEF